jgi:ACS family hexuronate transporter-like MFS transporter
MARCRSPANAKDGREEAVPDARPSRRSSAGEWPGRVALFCLVPLSYTVGVASQPIRNLRWWIGALLFASTVINYIDRQTLNVLAPYLKQEYHWTNTDFATIVIAFRVAYAITQMLAGRLLDWLGTRRGMIVTVSWYSAAAMLTAAANSLWGFRFFRFLLGCGEAGNWPGATKTVGEWFPDRERGWAVALFDSGSAVGAAVAPSLVVYLYHHFGTWRPAFLFTGLLGWLWLIAWSRLYHPPSRHPRVSPEEVELIERGHSQKPDFTRQTWRDWARLLTLPQTWGIVLTKSLMDPYWFLVADWFAIYLVGKGFRLEETLVGFWLPFMAADLGNFFGGGLSSYLISRGRSVVQGRKLTFLLCAPGMFAILAVTVLNNFAALIACFVCATFFYAACSTIYLALPSDLYPNRAVASVSGLSGTGAGVATVVSSYVIGRVTDATHSFNAIFIGASACPVLAMILMVWLVRRPVGRIV